MRCLIWWCWADDLHRDSILNLITPHPQATAWLAHSYDLTAPGYDETFTSLQQVKYDAMLRIPEVRSRLQGRVLDLGCGTGLLWEFVIGELGLASDILGGWLGMDCSPQMLERAKAKGLRTLCGDATNLPFPDGFFDLVLAFTSFGLTPGREQLEVAEALRVLHPDGLLVVTVLLASRDSLRHALNRSAARIIHEKSCGQDVGWVVGK